MEITMNHISEGDDASAEPTFRRELRVGVTVRSLDVHTHGEMARHHSLDRVRSILVRAAADIAHELRQVSNEARIAADLAGAPGSSSRFPPRRYTGKR